MEDRGARALDVRDEGVERFGEEQLRADVQRERLDGAALEHVGERQVRHACGHRGVTAEHLVDALARGGHAAEGVLDALGLPGAARGVDEQRGLIERARAAAPAIGGVIFTSVSQVG